jgi:PAS domain S-box-containing protein
VRESEARYRLGFKRSPVPLHTMDGAGVITGVSDSWLTLLGYRQDEVVGRHVTAFEAAGSPGRIDEDIARLMVEPEIRDRECRVSRRDGTGVDVLVSARLEHQGDNVLIVCVLVDISARRRAEAALRASEAALHQARKMEAVGQLTGGIAHDFNNLLQGIMGGLDLTERYLARGQRDEVSRCVTVARQAINRAAGLTHRMLAFARRQTLQPRPVNAAELVRGMAELIGSTVGPAIKLATRLNDGTWHALCDPNQLESALINLAINARDAMPDGGTLTIATAERVLRASDLPDHNEEARPGDYVEITVADTGRGMTQDVLARAFEPFFTTKPLGEGTGLGLSQIHGFVHQSGGVVKLESAPGQGTVVRLYLPRHAGSAEPRLDDAVLSGPHGDRLGALSPGRSIVVVEDEAEVLAQISETLRDLGCVVQTAADGASGLRRLRAEAPVDLLISDVGLPGMNGRQLADAAREFRPNLPVLLITGYAGTALEDMGLAPGMEILRKPFTLEALAERAREMLARSPRIADPVLEFRRRDHGPSGDQPER